MVLAVACIPNSASDDEADPIPGVPSGTVAIPPERLTPFCQTMIDLSGTLETDPPADVDALIIETYTELADQVPVEISNQFNAVLAGLKGEPLPVIEPVGEPEISQPSTTIESAVGTTALSGDSQPSGSSFPEGDAFFDEGYLPGDDPAERLNAYVDLVCRDNQNNPGPPASQPHDGIASGANDS